MRQSIERLLKRPRLAQRFMLASLLILVTGMIGMGMWVGEQIKTGVVNRMAATTALYVDSFVAPLVQELAQSESISPKHVAELTRLLQETPLGQEIPTFKLWGKQGRILYSTDPSQIGQFFSPQVELTQAWRGKVTVRLHLQDADASPRQDPQVPLLEMYSPVRRQGTNELIAVAGFYHRAEDLAGEITAAQQRSWLVVGGATLAMYLLLAGFVRWVSDTIARQQAALSYQVVQLTALLKQNEQLHERVRRAAARTTALNERLLRRIGAELHDGLAQDLSLALLRLDHVIARHEAAEQVSPNGRPDQDLDIVQRSLGHALQEVRAISAGMALPQLGQLTLADMLAHAVRTHERRTGTGVNLIHTHLPEQAPLSVKITLYRLVQEALNNAYRHAGGVGQRVSICCEAGHLSIEVSDQGPGFDYAQAAHGDEHLGLVGMRERIESLGGQFQIDSVPGRGTQVIAHLSLQPSIDNHER